MANNANLKPFQKGDLRINRSGRPKSFDALRTLSVALAHEVATDSEGQPVIGPHGRIVTKAEQILREWATSGDFQKQNRFLEIAFGKVPNAIEHSGPDGSGIVPIAVVSAINWQKLSDEELQKLIAMGEKLDRG